MKLSKDLKEILVAGVVLLMTTSIVGTGNVANAKYRHYRYRFHRVYRRHARRRYRSYKHHRRARRYYRRRAMRKYPRGNYRWVINGNNTYDKVQIIGHDKYGEPRVRLIGKKQIKEFGSKYGYIPSDGLYGSKSAAIHANKKGNEQNKKIHDILNSNKWRNAVAKDEMKLITKDRAEHGKAPLEESPKLDQVAQARAKQTYKNNLMGTSDPHMDAKTGKPYDDEVAQELGYNNLEQTMGENLDESEPSTSAKETAKNVNNDLYTSEEPSDGGHYQNIIGEYNNPQGDEDYKTVGVGAYGDITAEDFGL